MAFGNGMALCEYSITVWIKAIFNALAEAVDFVMRVRRVKWLDHYLDVFIVVGLVKVM